MFDADADATSTKTASTSPSASTTTSEKVNEAASASPSGGSFVFWHFNMESVYIIKTSICVMVQFVFQGSFCVLVNSELARINFT